MTQQSLARAVHRIESFHEQSIDKRKVFRNNGQGTDFALD
jgi:hypothetical protein